MHENGFIKIDQYSGVSDQDLLNEYTKIANSNDPNYNLHKQAIEDEFKKRGQRIVDSFWEKSYDLESIDVKYNSKNQKIIELENNKSIIID